MFKRLHLWKLRRQVRHKLKHSPDLFLREVQGRLQSPVEDRQTSPSLAQLKELASYLQKEGFFYEGIKEGEVAHFYQHTDFLPAFQTQRVFSTPPPFQLDFSHWPTLTVVWGIELQPPSDEEKRRSVELHPTQWIENIQEANTLYWTFRKEASIRAQGKKLSEFLAMVDQSTPKTSL